MAEQWKWKQVTPDDFRVLQCNDGRFCVQDLTDDYIDDERLATRREAEHWIKREAEAAKTPVAGKKAKAARAGK